ncbi:hypothetical protein D8I35_02355 [Corticibacter populi]|uniref:Uncharacterized protein n=1 Tax=Corticibacter populi TaxID=1550736 RepID=A0A3M6QZD7_9BURK|nr:hypothetical protein [Corticibacter populi]RMX07989.1 hypothetical protein D8I35_02355 [Corticibacter populi]RZS35231.1 hypothetical protein EV687_0291 [Corticibacter populi]
MPAAAMGFMAERRVASELHGRSISDVCTGSSSSLDLMMHGPSAVCSSASGRAATQRDITRLQQLFGRGGEGSLGLFERCTHAGQRINPWAWAEVAWQVVRGKVMERRAA